MKIKRRHRRVTRADELALMQCQDYLRMARLAAMRADAHHVTAKINSALKSAAGAQRHVVGALYRVRSRIPASFPVQPLRAGQSAVDPVKCLTCQLSWDDAAPTAYTPAPSGRCPFEEFHDA